MDFFLGIWEIFFWGRRVFWEFFSESFLLDFSAICFAALTQNELISIRFSCNVFSGNLTPFPTYQ